MPNSKSSAQSREGSDVQDFHHSKILVVDDEPDIEPLMLQRMRRQINKGQYEFVFARNGIEALEKLESEVGIDIVLSDINMPDMDGLTLLEKIPEDHPDVRSVIISAYGDMKNIRNAMNRGAFDFITKPVDFRDLRVTIERTLENMRAWRKALSYRDELVSLRNELEVAGRMQRSILPSHFPHNSQYEVWGSMKPARDVGGDFFDVVPLDKGRVGLSIADVSGKGIPAAMFMMACRTLLKGVAIGLERPSKVLREVNSLLCNDNPTAQFVTVLYGVYDPDTGTFDYASGGHEAPFFIRPGRDAEELPLTGGVTLGLADGLDYDHEVVHLDPGDGLALYTDGITEAQDVRESFFGATGLSAALKELPTEGGLSAQSVVEHLMDSVGRFVGKAPIFDDLTCLSLVRKV